MYHLLVAGGPQSVERFSSSLRPRLQRGQRLQSLQDGRPDLHAALERARQFLTLVALLAAMLAAVAVGTAARRFSERRVDSCALLLCFGLQSRQLVGLFALEFAWIGAAASVAGVLAGFGLHYLILKALGGLLPVSLPPPSLVPAWHGLPGPLVPLPRLPPPPLHPPPRSPPSRV